MGEERACPHCGSRKRKTMLGADRFIVMQVIEKPSGEVVSKVIICAECGIAYDVIKEVG